jgi:hypothetical protein
VTNTGTADLVDCVVTDSLYRDDPVCPADVGAGDPVSVTPDMFDLPASGLPEDVMGAVSVIADSCNTASVTCTIAGTAKTITATDDDECAPPECQVLVDKQVSCDGGATWEDVSLVSSNDDGNNLPCVASSSYTLPDGTVVQAEPILVRYQARNDSPLISVFDCTLTDSNPMLPGVIGVFDIPALTTTDYFVVDPTDCSDDLAAGEPDTAALSCFCSPDLDPAFKASASDGADFECQTPGLEIIKLCLEPDTSLGIVPVEILITNTGDADLANCVVSDEIYLEDSSCPADVGSGTPVPVSPDYIVDVPAGGSAILVTGETECPAVAEACNTATVTCEVVGSDQTITVSDDDLCLPCGEGCLSRTPGFWGTHPHVTEKFLPLTSCGIEINNTYAYTDGSSTEDMCFGGRDFKENDTSASQLQLIRQCMAAHLNIAATAVGQGSCESAYPAINDTIAYCCEDLCSSGADKSVINDSGCIGMLDAFNNLPDTLDPFGDFISPGPAQPGECRESNGNGWVNPGRYLGPRR